MTRTLHSTNKQQISTPYEMDAGHVSTSEGLQLTVDDVSVRRQHLHTRRDLRLVMQQAAQQRLHAQLGARVRVAENLHVSIRKRVERERFARAEGALTKSKSST